MSGAQRSPPLTIRASVGAGMAAYATSLGVTAEELAQRSGIELSRFLDHTAHLPAEGVAALWRVIAERHSDSVAALKLAAVAPWSTMEPFARAYRYASTLGSALRLFIHYRALLSPQLNCVLEVDDDLAQIEFEHPLDSIDGGHGAEFVAAMTLRVAEQCFGVRSHLRAVEFRAPPTGPRTCYRDFFGVDPAFEADSNTLTFDAKALDMPGHDADSERFANLEAFIGDLAPEEEPLLTVAHADGDGPRANCVSIEFLPRGGRLRLVHQGVARNAYLAGNRCDFVAALLRPSAPDKPGEWVQDEFLSRQVWPTSVRGRTDLNTLVYRLRQDLSEASIDPGLIEREGGATRLRLSPGADVAVS